MYSISSRVVIRLLHQVDYWAFQLSPASQSNALAFATGFGDFNQLSDCVGAGRIGSNHDRV